jgi:hypothetical protein
VGTVRAISGMSRFGGLDGLEKSILVGFGFGIAIEMGDAMVVFSCEEQTV